ncbi:hypothetical protein AXF42_Ash019583 [Apostasia shenzhenica]|uniref:Uncharacterized protein n=1 Tax=Apostasia shenzhenica TaxID=1088818 RepID=A0A2I0AV70_9ASPA|nr:hypothetical protein AXF42_Ash019583 [Apostasia shenzhenica]
MEGEGRRTEAASSAASAAKRGALSFYVSLEEGWQYVKAFFTFQVKKLTAKSEKEASEADIQQARMQVEATDEAERKRYELNKT